MGLSDYLISDPFLRRGQEPRAAQLGAGCLGTCNFLLRYLGSLGRCMAGCVGKVLIYGEVSGCLLEMSDRASSTG